MGVFARKQRGQAIVAALIIMVLSVAGLVLMYNTGQATSEKLRVVNAADAAAYSGGVWVARQLNFMAYTNRAMIANHVSVGHFVSFASWVENFEENAENLDDIGDILQIVPVVGTAIEAVTEIIEQVAEAYLEVTEGFGDVYVPAIDLFNRGLYASQVAARFNLNPLTLNDVMESAARGYGDGEIQVNDGGDLDVLLRQSVQGAQAAGQVLGQFSPIFNFVERYEATEDEGRAAGLVEASLDSSEDWIRGNRGWRFCLFSGCGRIPPNLRLTKRGSTVHSVDGGNSGQTRSNGCSGGGFFGNGGNNSDGDGLNWYARDELQFEIAAFRRFGGTRWRNTGFGSTCADANATDFDSSYKGIDNYYALNNQDSEHHTLSIYAYATLDTNATAVPVYHTFRDGVDPADPHYEVKRTQALTDNKTTALVEAQVFHGSEEEHLFSTEDGEYSNLFNPYWHARSQYGVYDRIATVILGVNGNN